MSTNDNYDDDDECVNYKSADEFYNDGTQIYFIMEKEEHTLLHCDVSRHSQADTDIQARNFFPKYID
ncbi:hypothetical protein BLA29_014084 [Euroglyphus maynei]|uniref:Uncharacterized protein n=1 Tax=Euroglyphus maynei TaxID=6958 RepID=A0A1Y3BMR0_EURMA|nr:hypothetical protein BLA29_014084 [Euroglyphus maynei]